MREGGRAGEREGEKEGRRGKKGGREGGKEGRRERGREGGRERGRGRKIKRGCCYVTEHLNTVQAKADAELQQWAVKGAVGATRHLSLSSDEIKKQQQQPVGTSTWFLLTTQLLVCDPMAVLQCMVWQWSPLWLIDHY